jgi:hypothetical protein
MLNIDGASKEHGRASCGGIVRGNNGEWLGDFAKFLGDYSPIVVNSEFKIPECVTNDLLYKQTKVCEPILLEIMPTNHKITSIIVGS